MFVSTSGSPILHSAPTFYAFTSLYVFSAFPFTFSHSDNECCLLSRFCISIVSPSLRRSLPVSFLWWHCSNFLIVFCGSSQRWILTVPPPQTHFLL